MEATRTGEREIGGRASAPSAFTRFAKLVDLGSLRPFTQRALPLSEACFAEQLSQAHRTRSKIVHRVD